ncbi:MAG TPA: universal stress protein, partial [Corynebacterium variabile]|nr:universal stress protein [Corynebacterium variabile]
WLTEALAEVPADVTASGHVVRAVDAAEGLLGAARTLDAGLIVIGARSGGLLRSHRLGQMASALLHTAHIPVAMAPTGYRCEGPVGRGTTMFGRRAGATDVIAVGLETAREREIPLRLVSLVMLDEPDTTAPEDTAAINMSVINGVYSYATDRLAAEASDMVDAGTATTVIATGRSVTDALTELDWAEDEIVLVASSRLAPHGHLFLGKTATKMMRTTPVPVIVVPAGYTHPAAAPVQAAGEDTAEGGTHE